MREIVIVIFYDIHILGLAGGHFLWNICTGGIHVCLCSDNNFLMDIDTYCINIKVTSSFSQQWKKRDYMAVNLEKEVTMFFKDQIRFKCELSLLRDWKCHCCAVRAVRKIKCQHQILKKKKNTGDIFKQNPSWIHAHNRGWFPNQIQAQGQEL